MSDKLEDLIDRYFDIAYQQGKEGRNHDDIEGSAQATLEAIRDEIKVLRTPAPSPIVMGVKPLEWTTAALQHSYGLVIQSDYERRIRAALPSPMEGGE